MESIAEKVTSLKAEIENFRHKAIDDLESFRLKFISKKGAISELFEEFKQASVEEKKSLGKVLNELKQSAETKFKQLTEEFESSATSSNVEVDLSLPSVSNKTGSLHPLNLTRYKIIEVFERLGFNVADGPEIEDDWHNFTALNFPENHPAREMQDTFFVEKNPDVLLRTHTSNVQIRLTTYSCNYARPCISQ